MIYYYWYILVINMPTKLENNYKLGSLTLREIKYDHLFKRVVMRSGSVGKVYLPKELIGRSIYIIVDLNNCNGTEGNGKEGDQTPKPLPSIPEAKTS
jgi:putative transposon-encoded protein